MKKTILSLSTLALVGTLYAQEPPKPAYPIPTPAQIEWHKMEQYAMICFGMSTFNDMEWGYGDTPLDQFAPIGGEIDVEQWVKVCKNAGMKGVLLVAKHHDGFTLWQSKYNEYGVKNTSWRNGKGDVLKDLAAACKKHNLQLALYLSPWDRNHAEYGKAEYVEYFHNQIKELMELYPNIFEYWFDGANGGDGYYGGARENRKIANLTEYYDYPRAVKTIKSYAPNAMIFGGSLPDLRWIGNESGWAGATNWAMLGNEQSKREVSEELSQGNENGDKWLPGEVDVSIRPGWYYHKSEDNKVKSLSRMVDIYYESVGRNANLLLSFCPDQRGRIHELDSVRSKEWMETIRKELSDNVVKGSKVTATNTRGKSYSASKITDGKYDTYWATEDGVTQASVTIKLPRTQKVNRLLLQEYIPLGQRVAEFNVEIGTKGVFKPIVFNEPTTTIGYKRILRFPSVQGDEIRINFTRSRAELCINNVEVFLAPNVISEPNIIRNEKDEVIITASDKESKIFYTTDGSEPKIGVNQYTQPIKFAQKGTIKAIGHDANFNKVSPIAEVKFDIPQSRFAILGNDSKVIFDNNYLSALYFEAPIIIDLSSEQTITGFNYIPDQNRWAGGLISDYRLYIGNSPESMQLVSQGQFSNIKNNPIEQHITFAPIKGKYIKFEATRIIDNQKKMGIADITVVTK